MTTTTEAPKPQTNVRERQPSRCASEVINYAVKRDGVDAIKYVARVGYYWDGRVSQVFLDAGKSGTDLKISSAETAIAVSLALQYGCPLEVLRKAMPRTNDERPEGAIGTLLDILAKDMQAHTG